MKKTVCLLSAIIAIILLVTISYADYDPSPPDTPLTGLSFGQTVWKDGYSYTVTKVPYCMIGGKIARKDEAGERIVVDIPPDPDKHSGLDSEVHVVEATCTQEGYTYKLCKACKKKAIISVLPIDPDAHTAEGAFEVLTHPTCISDGQQALKCKYCGQVSAPKCACPAALALRITSSPGRLDRCTT